MERSLLWGVFAIGWAGWLYAFLSSRAEAKVDGIVVSKPHLVLAVLLPLIVFAITLPVRPPVFSAGHGLGDGFLLGGIGALLSALVLCRPRILDSEFGISRASTLVVGTFSLAPTVAALFQVTRRDVIIDALVSAAIGWICVSLVLVIGCLTARQTAKLSGVGANLDYDTAPIYLTLGAAFATIVFSGAALGVFRGEVDLTDQHTVDWSTIALIFAAGVPVSLLLGSLPNRLYARIAAIFRLGGPISRAADTIAPSGNGHESIAAVARVIFSSAILLMLGKLLTYRLQDVDNEHLQRKVFEIMVGGVLGGLLVWWLSASRIRAEAERCDSEAAADSKASVAAGSPASVARGTAALTWQNSALAILLTVSGVMVAFELLGGFGMAILMLGAAYVAGYITAAATSSETALSTAGRIATDNYQPEARYTVAIRALQLTIAGAIFVLFRTFGARFDVEVRGVALTDHFAVFGLFIGIFFPRFLSGFVIRPRAIGLISGQSRIVAAGLLTLFVPAALLALWDTRCIIALLIGLAIGGAIDSCQSEPALRPSPAEQTLPGLFALAVALAVTQWTDHILPLADLTRAQKEHDLIVAAGVVVGVMLIAEISAGLTGRRKGTSPTNTAGTSASNSTKTTRTQGAAQ